MSKGCHNQEEVSIETKALIHQFLFIISPFQSERHNGIICRIDLIQLNRSYYSFHTHETTIEFDRLHPAPECANVSWSGGPRGMFWATEPHWAAPGTPFFVTFPTERTRKRVKEWHEGIFMKEWMKALKKTKISFGSYGRLKLKFLCEIYSPLRLQLLFNWFNKVQIYMEPKTAVIEAMCVQWVLIPA